VLASTRAFPVTVGALGVYGIGTSVGMVTFNSLLQTEAATDTRGRTFATFARSGNSGDSSPWLWADCWPTASGSLPSTTSAVLSCWSRQLPASPEAAHPG
jgi:hypothetical protein